MKKLIKFTKTTGTAAALTMTLMHGASAQTLSQTPLEATITVDPNVMLLLDDSLSMNNLTTVDGYDSAIAYPQWEMAGVDASLGIFFPNNLARGSLPQGTCPTDDFIEGTLGTETRCIHIPDPNPATSGLNDTLYALNYLRYLFATYTTAATPNVDLTDGTIPAETRVTVLRDAATTLVNGSDDIRWCLSDLLNDDADTVPLSACGADPLTAIANLDLDGGGTPLAETMFEIVKYFEQPHGTGGPIDYRCQKNFAVIITDGYPTGDTSDSAAITGTTRASYGLPEITRGHPSNTGLTDVTLPTTQSLPDWDGYDVITTSDDFFTNDIPIGSDGVNDDNGDGTLDTTFGLGNEGGSLFLDDMALFANEIDLLRTGQDRALQNFHDATDDTINDRFKQQNIKTYTIGFGIQNQMLADTAVYGKGLNSQASNAASLADALEKFKTDAIGQVGASSSSTATTAFLSGGNQLFRVRYDTSDWSGELISSEIDADPASSTFGELAMEADPNNPGEQRIAELWNTNTTLVGTDAGGVPANRQLMTVNDDTNLPVPFEWLEISDNQRANLGSEDVLDFLRGDQSLEVGNGGPFRDRSRLLPGSTVEINPLLGDIVHSQPVFVGSDDFGYAGADYQTFLTNSVENRKPVVYVGSNNGFLHGFDASDTSAAGSEVFAFAPRTGFSLLSALSDPDYEHHYSTDGRITLLDAQLQSGTTQDWATVLIGSMGAGGTGIFALDVTDPLLYDNLSSNADDVYLWEISDTYPVEPSSNSSTNLAPAGTATQSSDYSSATAGTAVASRANDGNTDGDYSNGSVTHTLAEGNAWWEIELANISQIEQIRVHNRDSSASIESRLDNFSVFVSAEPFTSSNFATTQAQAGVVEFPQSGSAQPLETFDTNDIIGRYVRVQLRGLNILSLAEVEIVGTEVEGTYKDLGRSLDRASIVRVNTDNTGAAIDWYALAGNGIHSADGNAVFYAIDLTTGEKVQEVILDDTGNNGIISNTAVDIDGDDSVDRVYLTDIKGNIWRLNWEVTATSGEFVSEYVDSSGDPVPFFEATETGDSSQQVVQAAIEVTRLPSESGTLFLHFGSGKYYDVEDSEVMVGDQQQTFYGVVDRGAPLTGTFTPLTKSDLESQTIRTASITGANNGIVRAVDGDPVDFGTQAGWYIDLPTDGERVVFDPVAIKDRILFTTLIPEPTGGVVDPCVPIVTGWLMEVDAINGISPDSVAFDANGDGDFDGSDTTALTSNSSGATLETAGIQPTAGAPLPPSLIRVDAGAPSEGVIKGIVIDSAANVEEFIHQAPISRTSWRRLN